MAIAKTPIEKVNDFIEKNYQEHLDKYNDGLTNHYSEWDDFKTKWNDFLKADSSAKEANNEIIKDMQRKINERERILKKYGLFNEV